MGVRRTKYDWSILDREGLAEYFWQVYPELTEKEIHISKVHSILSKHIKKYIPIKVTKKIDPDVEFDWIYVGGTYYADLDKEKQRSIEIIFAYNKFQNKIKLSKRRFRRTCYLIADTLLHEIMHMRQYRRRKFKDLPDYASTAEKSEQRQEQRYLGNSDEIDAYSFNIACELMNKFNNNRRKVWNYLNENQKGLRRRHNSWRMYLKAFDFNHEHPIIKRAKRKVVRYLPQAEIGKPYRNKDWLNL